MQDIAGFPMERVSIDILGELPKTVNGNNIILVVTCHFSKWTEAYALPDQTALSDQTADALVTNLFCRFGMPRTLHSDQGREIESRLFKEMCSLLGIEKTRTSSYHPQGNPQVERFNRTLQSMLKAYVGENRDDWDDLLPFIMMAYRATAHESTRLSPNKVMLGREIALPLDVVMGKPRDDTPTCTTVYAEWLCQPLEGAHQVVRDELGKASLRQKRGYDKRVKDREIRAGQFVWYWYPPRAKVKLGVGWTGPYLVTREISPLNIEIQLKPAAKPKVVHIEAVPAGQAPRATGRDCRSPTS